jgi:thiamine-monophosphate kinase
MTKRLNEFAIIRDFFTPPFISDPLILCGIGDDGAVLRGLTQHDTVQVIDTLVAEVHFDSFAPVQALAYKAISVNASDLSAMGATPRFALLAITLPEVDEVWLQEFRKGLITALDNFQVSLIGGDTTRGPLTITVQMTGFVPEGQALRRSGAKAGDFIYVSGALGAAGFAYTLQRHYAQALPSEIRARLDYPPARVSLGQSLRSIANAVIDVSDGLLADLNHILEASQVGARVDVSLVPVFSLAGTQIPAEVALNLALTAGDDYELCFTAPKEQHEKILKIGQNLQLPITKIGEITAEVGLQLHDDGKPFALPESLGYEHFGE